MAASRVLLVTGATGNQGGAVVDALIAAESSTTSTTIVAVTRDPNSASAKKLAAKSSAIKLIKGDLANPAALFQTARETTSQPVWGVFSIQVALGKGASPESEEVQGKALVDESLKQGVKHFVQTSVDRGGDEKSWVNPTNVPHFASKHNIEIYLRDQAAKASGSMTWTILRPVAFMDNFTPAFTTRVFVTALKNQLQDKPLQLVAARDIGIFGAQALLNADSSSYKNRAIGLAGDELSAQQVVDSFSRKTSSPPTFTFGILGSALSWGVKEIGLMLRWFASEGYGADIKKCQGLNPKMMNLEQWIEQSAFPSKK